MAFQTDFHSQLKDPKQKRLLAVAGVFFVAAGVIIYWVFFYSPAFPGNELARVSGPPQASSFEESPSQTQAAPQSQASRGGSKTIRESDIKRIKLDTDIVKSQLFKDLKIYSKDNPITVTEKGNPNPFQKPLPASPVFSDTTSSPTSSPEPASS